MLAPVDIRQLAQAQAEILNLEHGDHEEEDKPDLDQHHSELGHHVGQHHLQAVHRGGVQQLRVLVQHLVTPAIQDRSSKPSLRSMMKLMLVSPTAMKYWAVKFRSW